MAISDIPIRENGDDIDASWFNTIRTQLLSAGLDESVLFVNSNEFIPAGTTAVIVDASSGPVTLSLYNAGSIARLLIKAADATNDIIVGANPGQTIDGEISYTFRATGESLNLLYTGDDVWRRI